MIKKSEALFLFGILTTSLSTFNAMINRVVLASRALSSNPACHQMVQRSFMSPIAIRPISHKDQNEQTKNYLGQASVPLVHNKHFSTSNQANYQHSLIAARFALQQKIKEADFEELSNILRTTRLTKNELSNLLLLVSMRSCECTVYEKEVLEILFENNPCLDNQPLSPLFIFAGAEPHVDNRERAEVFLKYGFSPHKTLSVKEELSHLLMPTGVISAMGGLAYNLVNFPDVSALTLIPTIFIIVGTYYEPPSEQIAPKSKLNLRQGDTPLHVAVARNNKTMASLLMHYDADPHKENIWGQNCFDYAKENYDILKLLIK